jgi:hypothetical protein
MRNPLKRLFGSSSSSGKSPSKGGSLHNTPPIRPDADLYGELYNVWPDGTWNMQGYKNPKTMDEVARSALLTVAWMEQYKMESAAAGRMLNPGWFSMPSEIKPGWKPSEKLLKEVWAEKRWDVGVMHYMVGMLTHLRRIQP